MKEFLTRHSTKITGVLSGLDRLLIRGTLRQLVTVAGMMSYLNFRRVRLTEFADFAESITTQIRASAEHSAKLQQRPFVYLPSSQIRKEELAHDLLKKDPIDKGLVCILSAVEPCLSYEVHRSRERKQIELQLGGRKCLHLYHYLLHPTFGFMHVRVQTWFPFNVQVCLNGREWLSRQLDQAGITYQRRNNCFVQIEQVQQAQDLMQRQLRANWVSLLDELCQQVHPMHPQIAGDAVLPYYWAVNQMEWATDLMFDNRAALAALYPSLTRHAITHFSSAEVMRFLGRKLTSRFPGEIISDYGMRLEGLRVKHRVDGNSVKIYDKQGSVLRVETTLHQPRDLKIYRRAHGDPKSPLAWRRLVKGVSAIHRMAEVSQKANDRYLDALAEVENRTPLRNILKAVCRPTNFEGRRVRALRPWDEVDANLLQAIHRGEFVLNGFRNRQICDVLYGVNTSAEDQRRNAARVTRLLRMLRAHKIIRKLPNTHRYQLTKKGRQVVTAVLAARDTEIATLLKMAA